MLALIRHQYQECALVTWSGVVLMLYPYGVSETWMLWLFGVALSGWVYAKWD
jgi:hypothetical protein